MKLYTLLRNNIESAPLSLKELKNEGLYTSDLIWVTDESLCWSHPQDISELKEITTEPPKKEAIKTFRPRPQEFINPSLNPPQFRDATERNATKTGKRTSIFRASLHHKELLQLFTSILFVLFTALFVKKMVDGRQPTGQNNGSSRTEVLHLSTSYETDPVVRGRDVLLSAH